MSGQKRMRCGSRSKRLTSTRVAWVRQRPDADGNWGSIEKIAAETSVSPQALPELSIKMADLE